jgi:AcrR family transcriptional regulator
MTVTQQKARTKPTLKSRRLRKALPPRRKLVGRAEKSAARRESILAAALDEFSARGFAAARLDDIACKAGVAKGTIYLHFADKEALFQELVRTMLGPLVSSLDQMRAADQPIQSLLEQFADLFVGSLSTRRREVAYLAISEGARFPQLAEFYYREVIERAMGAMRAVLKRAIARGEIHNGALARFPQLVVAPGILAIIWAGLFDRFQHLDAAAMMRTHIEILLGQRSAS